MNDIIEFLTSKEIIVVYIVVAVACLLCFIVYLIDKNHDKRKQRQNTRKLNRLVEDVNIRMQEEDKKNVRKKKIEKTSDDVQPVQNNKQSVILQQQEMLASQSAGNAFVPEPIENMGDYYQINFVQETEIPRDVPQVVVEKNQNYGVNESVENSSQVVFDNTKVEELHTEASNSIEQAMNNQINKVNNKIDELVYTDPEPNREEATRELIKLAEELEKAERVQRSGNGIDISKYETEQEENAIISLDELEKKSEEMYAANEVTQYADEGNEPISLEDLEKRKMQVVNSEVGEQQPIPVETEVLTEQPPKQEQLTYTSTGFTDSQENSHSHAYQGSKIITQEVFSPIFGFDKNDTREKSREEIDEELQKTSEFLLSLKELQSKLNS